MKVSHREHPDNTEFAIPIENLPHHKSAQSRLILPDYFCIFAVAFF